MSYGFEVNPRSKKEIDFITKLIRFAKKSENEYFDIVHYLDTYVEEILVVLPDTSWIAKGWGRIEAFLCQKSDMIYVRESVYILATEGHPRARFTLAHELGHYFLHRDQHALTRYTRTISKEIFRDSEWQANYFAGSLLVPTYAIEGMEIDAICQNFGVSRQAAEVRISQSIKKR